MSTMVKILLAAPKRRAGVARTVDCVRPLWDVEEAWATDIQEICAVAPWLLSKYLAAKEERRQKS